MCVCVCDYNCQKEKAEFSCGGYAIEGCFMSVEGGEETKIGKVLYGEDEKKKGQRENAVVGIIPVRFYVLL